MAVNYSLQDRFLAAFFSSSIGGDFYLTGGTALSRFYLHHRESLDLDLFTNNQELDLSQVNLEIIKITQAQGLAIIKQITTPTFLQYLLEDKSKSGLKVDVVKDILVRFGDIRTEGKTRLDSLENIGSNKILAIFGRTDAKDFIDLYFLIIEAKLDFDHLYDLAKQKDLGLTEFYLANSINQLGQVSQYPVMLKPLDRQAMGRYYQGLVRQLLQRVKPD